MSPLCTPLGNTLVAGPPPPNFAPPAHSAASLHIACAMGALVRSLLTTYVAAHGSLGTERMKQMLASRNVGRSLLATLALLAACGSEPGTEPPVTLEGWTLEPMLEQEQPITRFVAVATPMEMPTDGTALVPQIILCDPDSLGNETSNLRCDRAGLFVHSLDQPTRIVFKARGAETSNAFLNPETPKGKLKVVMATLPLGEDTEDFVTRFDETTGPTRFAELGYTSDTELGPATAVKFIITNWSDNPKVYFQNTRKFQLHYNFANLALGMIITRTEFDKQTYYGTDRKNIAGTLVWYPQVASNSSYLGATAKEPLCMTFFPSDGLTAQMALRAHRLIEERIDFVALAGPHRRLVYLPAGDLQAQQLQTAANQFAAFDSAWVLRTELYGDISLQLLNPGVAYGTLRLVTPEQLENAPLSFQDILVLTALPNDLPIVGGTITEELQTPLAHVNIAARTRGTPNIALLKASTDDRVAPFLNKLVRFEVAGGNFLIEETSLQEATEYWDSLKKEPMYPQADLTRADLPLLGTQVTFEDAISVGVKAANLSELVRAVSQNTPVGFAVPFYYYQQFMTQNMKTSQLCENARLDCVKEGRSDEICLQAKELCDGPQGTSESFEQMAFRMIEEPLFVADTALREAALNTIRHIIRNTPVDPDFAGQLNLRVAQVFGGGKARLRSSTNAEDLPNFSGAGLYTSVGAYATGLDAASLEIRKVWASIWNFKAHEERSFWSIDHRSVKMAVLVSTAYPQEVANGVLITQNIADPTVYGMYVNVQAGEIAVTNPEPDTMPEIFTIIPAPGGGVQVSRQRFSSLSPNVPVMTEKEISALYDAGRKARSHFAKLYGVDEATFALDIEFKLFGPERKLILKQARPYSVGGYVP